MALEKAYKLLAAQEGVSNSAAKSMIDRGLVYVGNKKVM
ncbi:MAG: RNA pseudouridine synthase, partial [Sulfurimonas sp.]|nr:RNA pseudouridine synthase [Sulfurimonas sp.]